jgi:hypothetical protein
MCQHFVRHFSGTLSSTPQKWGQQSATVLYGQFSRSVLLQVDELKAHLKRMDDPEALAELTTGGSALGFRH